MSEFDLLKQKAALMEATIEHWFFESFHGSMVARSTDVWNAVHEAKEDLKRRLADLFAQSNGAEAPKE